MMMRTIPAVLFVVCFMQTVLTCVDVLFVLDPSSEVSRSRAIKVANELPKNNGIRPSLAVRRENGGYVFMMTENMSNLTTALETVHGDYNRYLNMVTSEIMRRRHVRPLVILVFSEKQINATLVTFWKDLSRNRKIHIFRVGTTKLKKFSELLAKDGKSFDDLIACNSKEENNIAIRRAPVSTSPTSTHPVTLPFSKTTRRPTTTRSTTVPGPKLRPIFRRVDKTKEGLTKPATNAVTQAVSTTTVQSQQVTTRESSPSQAATSSVLSQTTTPSRLSNPPAATIHVPQTFGFQRSFSTTRITSAPRIPTTTPSTRITSAPRIPTTTPSTRFTTRPRIPTTTLSTRITSGPRIPAATVPTRFTSGPRIPTTTRPTTTTQRVPIGCVADVIFLMDFSDSNGNTSKHYLDVAAATVGKLPIAPNAVRISLVRYSGPGRTETLFHLDKHAKKDNVIEELFHNVTTGGTTRTAEAIRYAIKQFENRKHGARKNAQKFIVVFTDGYSQDDPSTAGDEARSAGIRMIAVAIDNVNVKPNMDELAEITRDRNLILISPNGQQLRDKILGNLCYL